MNHELETKNRADCVQKKLALLPAWDIPGQTTTIRDMPV